MKGKIFAVRLTSDRTFNFHDETMGRGAMGLSIRNVGETNLIIDDATQEEIAPGEYFLVENNIAIVNTDFRVKFKKDMNKRNDAVMRYIVPMD